MTTTTDKGKSLGEKLHDAGVRGYQAKSVWRDLPDATKAQMEKTALAFVASLSDNASLKAAEARAIAAEEALKVEKGRADRTERAFAWLAENQTCELSHSYEDEDCPGLWRVHRVSGNINDREWTLVSADRTPLQAVERAMLAESMAARPASSTEAQS